ESFGLPTAATRCGARDRARLPACRALREPLGLLLHARQARQRSAVCGRVRCLARLRCTAAGHGLRAGPARAHAACGGVAHAVSRCRQRCRKDPARARRCGAPWLARRCVRGDGSVALDPRTPRQRCDPRRAAVHPARRAGARGRCGDRDADAGREAGDPHRARRWQRARTHHARGGRVLARAGLDECRADALSRRGRAACALRCGRPGVGIHAAVRQYAVQQLARGRDAACV
ncbi:MAG: hypothetical protein AVDCRST_MAG71-1168, partial [uncultured Lysobacter sp.]